MGLYVIALYFGNSLGPLFTGVIVESASFDRKYSDDVHWLTSHRG